jgi:hypothetical protein
MPTIPSQTRVIDDAFTTTWYEIQKKAIDNILTANVLMAALKTAGCMKPQVGGTGIERTVRYGKKTAISVARGDTLPTGETDIETAAFWQWKYLEVHVQRSLQQDQQNSGPAAIKSLVQMKIEAARDAMNEAFENAVLGYNFTGAPPTVAPFAANIDTTYGGTELRAARDPYSIFNFMPDTAYVNGTGGTYNSQTAGNYTYGGIDTWGVQGANPLDTTAYTGNAWFQPKYSVAVNPAMQNLEDQVRTLYNYCSGGSNDEPDLMVMDQTRWEAAADIFGSKIQITTHVGDEMARLGYRTMQYLNARMIWTPNAGFPSGNIALLNTRWIDLVYDPNYWFGMTEWMWLPNQMERIARIMCTFAGAICSQPRRQGRLAAYTA